MKNWSLIYFFYTECDKVFPSAFLIKEKIIKGIVLTSMDLQSNPLIRCHDSSTVSLRDPETVPSCVLTGPGSQTDS